ncbi:MAG: 50S ribosomal protein L29 [Desulfotomaculales bacterium]
MKPSEIRALSDEELRAKVDEAKGELFRLRLQLATGQLDNPNKIREVRRRIARLKTILRERELGIR